MAMDKGFSGGFLAELMETDDVGLDLGGNFSYPSSFPAQNHNMFSFGNGRNEAEKGFLESGTITQKSGSSGSDSSSTSSSSSSFSKSMKAESGEAKTEEKTRNGPGHSSGSNATVADRLKASKKPKTDATSSTGPLKIRKEKLGERITALQQLVSPYGKTDTASVLHEAMGYIRFLHDQVQVLSTPYLQRLPSSVHMAERGNDESRYDLRSRGLCLVPVACTVHVANSNGADFWSPSMGSSNWSSR